MADFAKSLKCLFDATDAKKGACFASSNRVLSHINSNLVFQGELAGSQYMYTYFTIPYTFKVGEGKKHTALLGIHDALLTGHIRNKRFVRDKRTHCQKLPSIDDNNWASI